MPPAPSSLSPPGDPHPRTLEPSSAPPRTPTALPPAPCSPHSVRAVPRSGPPAPPRGPPLARDSPAFREEAPEPAWDAPAGPLGVPALPVTAAMSRPVSAGSGGDAHTWEIEEGVFPHRPLSPFAAASLFRLLLPGGPGGAPRARPGGTAALGALLRCFPCERLCGGCAVPPGALPPAMPPPARRRLPPRTFRSYLPRSHRTYSCVHCRAHLARHEELISKSFQGSHGRAYLFNSVVNVGCGPAEQRLLLTGLHSVADIFCQSCKTTLGWKYEQAFESSQKYKEGKFIIEMSHMVKENGWD
ncbi:protein yippee-like 4 [Corvus moneduloides]|nr:protein yippee-like 4 [Corvus moneduloides]